MESHETKRRLEEIRKARDAEAVKVNVARLLEPTAGACEGLLTGWDVVTLSIAISLKRIADILETKGKLST